MLSSYDDASWGSVIHIQAMHVDGQAPAATEVLKQNNLERKRYLDLGGNGLEIHVHQIIR